MRMTIIGPRALGRLLQKFRFDGSLDLDDRSESGE